MVAQHDKIIIIVGIIDELVRTMDLLLENKKIDKIKSLIGQGLLEGLHIKTSTFVVEN